MRKVSIGWHVAKAIIMIKCGKRVPIFCQWDITDRCNMNCVFCSAKSTRLKSTAEASTDLALNIINELHKLGTRIILFSGGEPTLRRDLPLLIEAAKKRNILVSFTTNGSASIETMEKLLCADIIRVSVDGVGQLHDSLRNSPGSYDKAIQTVKFCLSNNKSVAITTVYSKITTINDMEKLLSVARDLGVQVAIIPVSQNVGLLHDKLVPDYLCSSFGNYLMLMKKLIDKYGNTVADSDYYIKAIEQGGLDKYGCRAMDTTISIKADGSVSMPCNGLQLKLKKGSLKSVYYSEDAKIMRELQGYHIGCKGCPIKCMISASALLRFDGMLSLINSYRRSII